MSDNNIFFNRLLHLTGLGTDDLLCIAVFKLGKINASKSQIKGWRTASGRRSVPMPDDVLNGFFDGCFLFRDKKADEGVNLFYTDLPPRRRS